MSHRIFPKPVSSAYLESIGCEPFNGRELTSRQFIEWRNALYVDQLNFAKKLLSDRRARRRLRQLEQFLSIDCPASLKN